MNYLEVYTNTIRERGNESLARTIEKTADEVGQKYLGVSRVLCKSIQ